MSKKKVYTISNAHLDTIWSWDFETTVNEYIYNTLVDNFKLFEKYPDYVFNFEGAYRYELMQEYYPELFEKVKDYVEKGRWHVTGSAYENGDVNVPSPEALFRNILYGNGYFKKTFGKTSTDIFLPDCFGFGWALPSIAHHAGLKGFSTQKLSWGSAYGVPYDIGVWQGVDGNSIFAAIKMGSYVHTLSKIRDWDFVTNKLKDNSEYDLGMTAVYYGTGDRGGAPKEKSAKTLEKELALNPHSDTEIIAATPDRLFGDLDNLSDEQKEKLPIWNNELLMSTHAVGSYVSRSISKRWNRRGETLADMAERSAVLAYLLGREYPEKTFETCWKRIIKHQFHDDLTGTSVQRAYRRVWNDYAMSINQLIGEYEASSKYISDRLDTSFSEGVAVTVNNPCEFSRKGIVEVSGDFGADSYTANDKEGNGYVCQKTDGGLIFEAELKPLCYKAFDIREGSTESESSLKVSEKHIENKNYKVEINEDGFVSSIVDKTKNKELLKAPIRLALYDYEGSRDWPAWEIPENEAKGTAHYPKLVSASVLENGPVRASIKLEYEYAQSKFATVVSLSENGEAVEFQNEIIWHEFATIAKQEFKLNASNNLAAFDLGLGAIKRRNRTEKLYEVPAQKWADLSDADGGISIISDSKYSWDKFDDSTLRLTVLHTPKKNYRIDSMQSMMDLGLNRFGFAVTSHEDGDFAKTNRIAECFHKKMPAFVVPKHSGELGSEISLGGINSENVMLRALKKAEGKDSIVLRFNEINNDKQEGVRFEFFKAPEKATRIYASENPIEEAKTDGNALTFDMGAYAVESFELEFAKVNRTEFKQTPVELDGNVTAYSFHGGAHVKGLPSTPLISLAGELAPEELYIGGIKFKIDASKEALITKGQTLTLPENAKRVHLLCGSLAGDTVADFGGEEKTVNAIFENYAGWDLYDYKELAFIKDGRLGYEFTHSHSGNSNITAKQALFYVVSVDVKDGVLKLPEGNILILAATADEEENSCRLATELFEKAPEREFGFVMDKAQKSQYNKYRRLGKMNDKGRYYSTKNK